MSTVITISH